MSRSNSSDSIEDMEMQWKIISNNVDPSILAL